MIKKKNLGTFTVIIIHNVNCRASVAKVLVIPGDPDETYLFLFTHPSGQNLLRMLERQKHL